MARVSIPSLENLPELKSIFEAGEKMMGFVPNDGLIMAYRPDILKSFLGLVQSIYANGHVEDGLKRMIGLISSGVAGCQYCQVHASNAANQHGVENEKIKAVWEFESSSLFTKREKAASRIAQRAAMVPNAVSNEDFEQLKKYFDTQEIIEIVSVISMYGFLNRWNATLQTDIEDKPLSFIKSLKDV